MSDSEGSGDEVTRVEPLVVEYCPSCSFPPEFCEFGNKWDQCQLHLKSSHPDLLEKFQALRIASGKVDEPVKAADEGEDNDDEDDDEDDEDNEDDAPEPVAPAPRKPVVAGNKKEVILAVRERTRRKRVTTIQGIETTGINAKELVKALSKKFATSASDTDDGICLNGELDHDIAEYLLQTYPNNVSREHFFTIVKGGMKRKFF